MLIGEQAHRDPDLAQLADALDLPGLVLGALQGREEQPSQNRDDGDDDQQFDQGERVKSLRATVPPSRGFLEPRFHNDWVNRMGSGLFGVCGRRLPQSWQSDKDSRGH
jgi:hypothetical protein